MFSRAETTVVEKIDPCISLSSCSVYMCACSCVSVCVCVLVCVCKVDVGDLGIIQILHTYTNTPVQSNYNISFNHN